MNAETESLYSVVRSRLSWWRWKAWNRTRYYWPQAQSRKRAMAKLESEWAEQGMKVYWRKPWWLP